MSKPKAGNIERLPKAGNIEVPLLERLLSNSAFADAKHDFKGDAPSNTEQVVAYEKGLYTKELKGFENMDEAQCLQSVVKNSNYEPILSANSNKDFCHVSPHEVVTKNDNNYTVYYADVKWTSDMKKNYYASASDSFKEDVKRFNKQKNVLRQISIEAKEKETKSNKKGYIQDLKDKVNSILNLAAAEPVEPLDDREEIDAPMFYSMMNLDVTQTIAIVVDAASIGLIQILSTGTFIGVRPTVYYIFGPEVENDPATKKHPSSPDFKNPATYAQGVIFIPCVSLNPSDFVYCYEYVPNSELYLDKFFTNFKFELSELKETPKGKIIEYTTDLTIKSFEGGKVKFIDESVDSKSKNDITFLTKIINALKNSNGEENEFKYAISFLKKMSGDWLQVLLTLAVTNRTRGFTPYKIEPGLARRPNITKNIDRVFFVTHDRIALAFALLMGVECLFTHHTPVQGNPSLHSAFLYSLTSQAAVDASILEKATIALNEDYYGAIVKLTTDINEYNENCDLVISANELKLTTDLDKYLKNMDEPEYMFLNQFDKCINKIFTSALEIVAIKKFLPDLKTSALNNIIQLNVDLQIKKTEFANTDVVKAKELLALNATLSTDIKNFEKILVSAKKMFENNESGEGLINAKQHLQEFTKTLVYNSAKKWTWDSIEVSNRSLSKLNNMTETVKFNADRNIFLYNIDAINDDHKQQIVNLFAKCYLYILKNTTDPNKFKIKIFKSLTITSVKPPTQHQFNKFKIMATSFCYEVFYNFGGFCGIEEENNPLQILEYCENIIAANSVVAMWEYIKTAEAMEPVSLINKLSDQIGEPLLFKEMNEFDSTTGTINPLDNEVDGVDEGAADVSNQAITSAAAAEPPLKKTTSKHIKTDMKCSSVSIACKMLTSRLFAGRGEYMNTVPRRSFVGGAHDKMYFSPSLPIQILLFQLSKTLKNENYYESGDLELVLQYYDFLLKMRKSLSEKNKGDSEKIGLGICEFFFINNSVSEKNKSPVSTKLINMSPKMLSLTGLLTTGFCGVLNETYFKDKESRKKIIEDPVFVEFIRSIDVPNCFKTQYDLVLGEIKYSEFVDAVSQSAREMYVTKTKSKTRTRKTSSIIKSRSKANPPQGKTRRKTQKISRINI